MNRYISVLRLNLPQMSLLRQVYPRSDTGWVLPLPTTPGTPPLTVMGSQVLTAEPGYVRYGRGALIGSPTHSTASLVAHWQYDRES